MDPVQSRFGQGSSDETQQGTPRQQQQPFSNHRSNTHPSLPQFTQAFTMSSFGGSHTSVPSSMAHSSAYAPPILSPTGLVSNQNFGGSSQNFEGGNGNGGNSGNHDSNNNNSSGLESLESLAALSVLSPALPLQGEGSGRKNSLSDGQSGSGVGYFSPSFQPPQSLPVIYQSQATGSSVKGGGNNSGGGGGGGVGSGSGANNLYHSNSTSSFQSAYNPSTHDLFSSFQGQRKQNPYQQQQPPARQMSSYSITSPLSSSLPAHYGLQHHNQQQQRLQTLPSAFSQHTSRQHQYPHSQQDQSYRPSQQQQQHYSQNISLSNASSQSASSSTFTPDTARRPRSRSKSLTTTTTSLSPVSFSTDKAGSSITLPSPSKKVVVPPHPRELPPRAPQLTAPRKYHGRQTRKVPIPSIDHHEISGLSALGVGVPPTRRLAHILSEQKRREKINSGFDELKTVIPDCAQNTDSKATILRKAVDRILELEDELRKYTDAYQHENNDDADNDYDHHDHPEAYGREE